MLTVLSAGAEADDPGSVAKRLGAARDQEIATWSALEFREGSRDSLGLETSEPMKGECFDVRFLRGRRVAQIPRARLRSVTLGRAGASDVEGTIALSTQFYSTQIYRAVDYRSDLRHALQVLGEQYEVPKATIGRALRYLEQKTPLDMYRDALRLSTSRTTVEDGSISELLYELALAVSPPFLNPGRGVCIEVSEHGGHVLVYFAGKITESEFVSLQVFGWDGQDYVVAFQKADHGGDHRLDAVSKREFCAVLRSVLDFASGPSTSPATTRDPRNVTVENEKKR